MFNECLWFPCQHCYCGNLADSRYPSTVPQSSDPNRYFGAAFLSLPLSSRAAAGCSRLSVALWACAVTSPYRDTLTLMCVACTYNRIRKLPSRPPIINCSLSPITETETVKTGVHRRSMTKHKETHKQTQLQAHTHAHVHARMRARACTHACVRMHAHARMRACARTRIRTQNIDVVVDWAAGLGGSNCAMTITAA